jgi:hypothetical protein
VTDDLTWHDPCDYAADWLYADVDHRDRDLLGQHATAYQINTATTIKAEGELL